jgi:hypothetical protein
VRTLEGHGESTGRARPSTRRGGVAWNGPGVARTPAPRRRRSRRTTTPARRTAARGQGPRHERAHRSTRLVRADTTFFFSARPSHPASADLSARPRERRLVAPLRRSSGRTARSHRGVRQVVGACDSYGRTPQRLASGTVRPARRRPHGAGKVVHIRVRPARHPAVRLRRRTPGPTDRPARDRDRHGRAADEGRGRSRAPPHRERAPSGRGRKLPSGRGDVTSTARHVSRRRCPAHRFRLAITCNGHQHRAGPAGQDMPRRASGHGHGGRVAQEGM